MRFGKQIHMQSAGRVALYLVVLAALVHCAHSKCQDTPNFKWLNVAGFMTIAEEEYAAPTYTGPLATEGSYVRKGYILWAETVNNGTGIVLPNGEVYCVNLTLVNIGGVGCSNFSNCRIRNIAAPYANGEMGQFDFFLGPYSSSLVIPLMMELEKQQRVTFAPVASKAAFYCLTSLMTAGQQPDCVAKNATDGSRRFNYLYGSMVPAENEAVPQVTLFRLKEVKTLVTWSENAAYPISVADGGYNSAIYNKINVLGRFKVPADPNYEQVLNVTRTIMQLNPDAVVGGTYYASCRHFVTAMRELNWAPRGVMMSLCGAEPRALVDKTGDMRYLLDFAEWDVRLFGPDYIDALYFPPNGSVTAPQAFAAAYAARWGAAPEHIGALATGQGELCHLLLNQAGSNDPVRISQLMQTFLVSTFAGKFGFNGWGQNQARDVIVLQQDQNGMLQVLHPLIASTADMVFPIPAFGDRTFSMSYLASPVEIALTVICAILMASSVVILIIVFVKRENHIFLAASPVFCYFILLGSLITYSVVFAWAEHATDAACYLRWWFLGIGFVLMFGALFAKTYRVMRIFTQKRLMVVRISNADVGIMLGALVGVMAIILIIWSAISKPISIAYNPDVVRPAKTIMKCTNGTSDTVMLVIGGIYVLLLIIAGIAMSIRIWKIPAKAFNEAKQIGFSMYNMFFFAVIAVGLQGSGVLDENAMFIVRSLCIMISTFITIMTIFMPKILLMNRPQPQSSTGAIQTTSGLHLSSLARGGKFSTTFSSTDSSDLESKHKAEVAAIQAKYDKLKIRYTILRGKYDALKEGANTVDKDDSESQSQVEKSTKKATVAAKESRHAASVTESTESSSSSSSEEKPVVAKKRSGKKAQKSENKTQQDEKIVQPDVPSPSQTNKSSSNKPKHPKKAKKAQKNPES